MKTKTILLLMTLTLCRIADAQVFHLGANYSVGLSKDLTGSVSSVIDEGNARYNNILSGGEISYIDTSRHFYVSLNYLRGFTQTQNAFTPLNEHMNSDAFMASIGFHGKIAPHIELAPLVSIGAARYSNELTFNQARQKYIRWGVAGKLGFKVIFNITDGIYFACEPSMTFFDPSDKDLGLPAGFIQNSNGSTTAAAIIFSTGYRIVRKK